MDSQYSNSPSFANNGTDTHGSSIWSWTDPRSFSEDFLVAIGVVLASLASFLTCIGLAIQKTSLCATENTNISPWHQPKWVMGFVCMMLGNVIDFLSFGFAPQSLLAPLAALSLVWNLFVSRTLLGEKYGRVDIVSCAFIFAGTFMTVAFSNHHENEYTLDTLRDLYHRPRMFIYAFVTPTLLGIHYIFVKFSEGRKERSWRFLGLLGWCGFSGIVGGNSILFAKSSIELLKDAFHGDDVFLHIDTYFIVSAMVACLLLQISFLNGAMLRYDQLHIMPVYQSYWIISGVVGGLVYFGEFEELSVTDINMFILGTFTTLFGLYQLMGKDGRSITISAKDEGFDVLPSRRTSDDFISEADLIDYFEIEMKSSNEDEKERRDRRKENGYSFSKRLGKSSSSSLSVDSLS